MLSARETNVLLGRLCTTLGFCIPPVDQQRLADEPPADVVEFTDAVFVAEGLDPVTADRRIYREVKAMVAEAFHQCDARQIADADRRDE